MKKIIIALIIIFFLILILFSVFKNLELSKNINNYQKIDKLAYSLELLLQRQQLVLQMSDSRINYDDFVIKNKESQDLLKELGLLISLTDDEILNDSLSMLNIKYHRLEYIYEDIKTDRAVHRNSFLMISKKYKDDLSKRDVLNSKDIQYLIDVLSSAKHYRVTDYKTKDELLNIHLKILNEKQKSLVDLNNELIENSLYSEIENLINYSDARIEELIGEKTKIINLLLSSSLFFILSSFIFYRMGVNRDIDELIEARDAAVIAENAKDEFFSNMSHELRTPLNSIYGFSNVLLKEIKDKKHLKYVSSIVVSSEHLIGLINDILDLSKLQSGKFSLDINPFNPDEKIEILLERFDAHLSGNNLTLKKDVDRSLNTTLIGDWLRISQVITNLLSNAIKFSHNGDSVFFSAKYKDGNLIFVVRDTGIGMNEDVQKKVFNSFEQADSSTTRKYGGTGLGLSIVRSLVEQMDATMELNSKQGEGTEFIISIPLEHSQEELPHQEKEQEEQHKLDGHILVVEDNKTNQLLIGILIDELGLSYDIANDGIEAIEMFKNNSYELILMDENMPNLNGIGAMMEIRKLNGGNLPIIALTANVMIGDEEKFLSAGMDGYLSKPIQSDKLYKVLESFLNIKI